MCSPMILPPHYFIVFFFNDTATTEIYPLSLHDALPIYLHAEGYPAAEMKHGPIALIDADMPVVFVAPRDEVYPKVLSNRSEEHTSELQSQSNIVCRLLLDKKQYKSKYYSVASQDALRQS